MTSERHAMTTPFVSVVMCTYNRAELLKQAIASLVQQQVDFDYEIVIVDNLSTDHTQDVLQAAIQSSPVPIHSVIEPKPGVSAARNRTISESHGEWIASVDDDEIAAPDWLQQLVSVAQRRSSRCVGGRVELDLPQETLDGLSPVCRDLLGESAFGDVEQRYTRRHAACTGNLLVHRSVFEEIGLFDESLTEGGEDTDLSRRVRQAGIDGWYTPHAIVHHHVPEFRLTPKYLLWAAERNGWHIARREHRSCGPAVFPLVMAGRFGQMMIRFLPSYLLALVLGRSGRALAARCLLRRTKAYLKCGATLLVPNVFPQEHLRFRSEREMFASPNLAK